MREPFWSPDDLIDQLKPSIAPAALSKGEELGLADRVEVQRSSAHEVVAIVLDRISYSVKVTFRPATISAICTCGRPSRGQTCAHVWAVLLVAEDRRLIPDLTAEQARPPAAQPPPAAAQTSPAAAPTPPAAAPTPPAAAPTPPAAARAAALAPVPRKSSWTTRLDKIQRQLPPVPLQKERRPAAVPTRLVYAIERRPSYYRGTELAVRWGRQRLDRRGWSPVQRVSWRLRELPDDLPASDRAVLTAFDAVEGGHRYYGEPKIPATISLGGLAALLLPVLCATGRCVVAGSEHLDPLPAYAWDGGGPWTLELDASDDPRGTALTPFLARGAERAPLEPETKQFSGTILQHGTRLFEVNGPHVLAWLQDVAKHGPLLVPKDELPAAIRRLGTIARGPALIHATGFAERSGVPQAVLSLNAGEGLAAGTMRGEALFEYASARVPALPAEARTLLPETRELVLRDSAVEQSRLVQLTEVAGGSPGLHLDLPLDRIAPVAEALLALGWTVEAAGRALRTGGRVKTSVESGIDWFDLSGSIEFDGEHVPLPAVLEALRRGQHVVTLGDGSQGVLPSEWVARLRLLEGLSSASGSARRFQRAQAGFLEGLLEGANTEVDAGFREARAALATFERIDPAPAPAGFEGTLRTYQMEGLGWMEFLDRFGFGGCLADDMGLGKTVQVLARVVASRTAAGPKRPGRPKRRPPWLVVMPRSLLFNWREEAARFAPKLSVLVHHGTDRATVASSLARHDLVLTTYGTLRRDVDWLKTVPFDYLVLDEAQAVKNAATAGAHAVRALQARRRLALTGTPVENHLGELEALMDFLNPGLFGTHRGLFGTGQRLDPALAATLRTVLRPFLLRRTKAIVASQLPDRTEQTVMCELDPAQRKIYDELRDHYRARLLSGAAVGGQQFLVLEALLRLRQVACHPGLVEPKLRGGPSVKLDTLMDGLAELVDEGHKVLVFSQFTQLLDLVRQRVDKAGFRYEYLDGKTVDRAARVTSFQTDPAVRVFLISLRAGGVGLNLTAADYVYILDPWWNPAVEAQAIDRAHRIGQTRPVVAYRLVAKDTVEERILELQSAKRELADAILSEDGGPLQRLTREDLEMLLA